MANEQTSVPLFVADTILTAAQQNISAGTGVPVFATTVTRDAAFGGANKALAEGQLCYLSATNVTQQYNGASWETVGPTATGSFLITAGSVSSGTTVSLDSIFSATYQNYYIIFSNIVHAGTTNVVQLRTGGATNTTSNYSFGRSYLDVSAMAWEGGSGGTTGITLGSTTAGVMNTWEMVISRPFATGETSGWFRQAAENTVIVSWFGFHLFKATTSFDGLIYTAGSTFTSASYAIYGLAN